MPVSKQTRRSRHEQAEAPTLERGNPSSSEGRVGTQQFRTIAGKGLVHMVRSETGWKEMGSSQTNTNQGDKVESTTISAGISASNSVGGGTAISVHGNLTSLSEDDHSQYVHLSNVRTISGNHVFSGAPQFNNIDVNGGDIASQTTINKSPVVTLAGDLGGNATFSNLGNATLTATIQPNSVALTTDTTGNYMTNVTGNSQVSVSHSQGEGSTAALSIAGDSIGDTQLAYNTGQHLTTGSAVTFATVDTGQGANKLYDMNQNVLTTSSPQFSNMTLGEYSSPNYSNGEIGTSTFASGFTGTGWKMSKSGNEYNLETNNMMIRGTLSVYELLIQQIRASNGAIFVSSSAKVESASSLSASDDNGTITFEDPSNNNICPFAVNDLIMMQRINPGSLVASNAAGGATNVIKKLVYKVTQVNGKIITVEGAGYNNTSSPSEGDDFVRIGNTDNDDRKGIIYLTSDDSNSPFIDIKSDIDSYSDWTGSTPKVRLGKLNGITDSDLGGNLSGFGLYSNNIFLKGKIVANSGSIGGVNLSSNSITVGSGGYGNANQTFYLGNDGRFSLKDKLSWDGSTLAISGDITISNSGDFAPTNATNNRSDSATDSAVNSASKTGGSVGGWSLSASAITGSNIVMSSNGTIAVANGYTLNNDGSASFANGGITFATNGDITSNTYLIERTRLFGNGADSYNGSSYIDTWISATTSQNAYGESSYGVHMAPANATETAAGRGVRILERPGGSANYWIMKEDAYFKDFTVKSGTYLLTNGYRIFCSGTLTIESNAAIRNNGGTASSTRTGASGGVGGTLHAGASGKNGGLGGEGTQGAANQGGYGGGGGGSGGIILISARYISNSGNISATGGNGSNGESTN